MPNKLKRDDTVLLTGASSGIGKAMAYEYAQRGKDLILIARSEDKLIEIAKDLEKKYRIKSWVFAQDLTKPEAVDKIFNFTKTNGINVTYLINNAGFGLYGEYNKIDPEKEAAMLSLNIIALTSLTKKYLPLMEQENYGKIMNVASIAALNPVPFMATYGASKAYVLSFTEAIATEYAKKGIQVMCLLPGYTATKFQDVASVHQSNYSTKVHPVSAEKVAKYAVKRLEKGKTVSIHQKPDQFLDFLMRFMPRKLIRNTAKKLLQAT